jgi:hypothetical protein
MAKKNILSLFDRKDVPYDELEMSRPAASSAVPYRLVTQAMTQDEKFEIRRDEDSADHYLSGKGLGLEEDQLVIALDRKSSQRQVDLADNMAVVRFAVTQDKRKLFCRARTRVTETRATSMGVRLVALDMPKDVEVNERRMLRLTPEREHLTALMLWAAKNLKVGQERDPMSWGPPSYDLSRQQAIEILDISGGGLCLALPLRSDGAATLTRGRKFFLRLGLALPAKNETMDLLLFTRVQATSILEKTRKRKLGLQIVGVGQMEPNNQVTWRSVPKEGLDELADWVFTRHLEACRMQNRQNT